MFCRNKVKDETFNATKNTAFAKGDIVLARYEDGVYYKAEIIQFSYEKFHCIIKYIDYDGFHSVSFSKMKPLTLDTKSKATNEVFGEFDKQVQESKRAFNGNQVNKKSKYLVGDTVLATYDDGEEYIAEITEIGDYGTCIVMFIEYNDLYETSIENIKHTSQNSSPMTEDCVSVVSATNHTNDKIKPLELDMTSKASKHMPLNGALVDNRNNSQQVLNTNIEVFEDFDTQVLDSKAAFSSNELKEKLQYFVGDTVLATYNDGEEYIAEIIEIGDNGVCRVLFIEYNDLYETSIENIKHTSQNSSPIAEQYVKVVSTTKDTNEMTKPLKLETTSKASKHMSPNGALVDNRDNSPKLLNTNIEVFGDFDKQDLESKTAFSGNQVRKQSQYVVGDRVLATYDDGKEYIAEITEIGDNGTYVVWFIEYNDLYETRIENIKHTSQNSSPIAEDYDKVVSATNDTNEMMKPLKLDTTSETSKHMSLNSVLTGNQDKTQEILDTNIKVFGDFNTQGLESKAAFSDNQVNKKSQYLVGDTVLATYDDGEEYVAKITEIGDNSKCVVLFMEYNDLYETSIENIKHASQNSSLIAEDYDKVVSLKLDTTSKVSKHMSLNGALTYNQDNIQLDTNIEGIGDFDIQVRNSKAACSSNQVKEKLKYVVGDRVLATYDDGEEYIAEITEIGDNGTCVVMFIEFNDLYETSIENIKHASQNSDPINEQCVKVVLTTNDSCQTNIGEDLPENKSEPSEKVEDFKDDNDNVTEHNKNIKNFYIETENNNPKSPVKNQHAFSKASDKKFEKGDHIITLYNNGLNYHIEMLDMKHSENMVVIKFLKSNKIHKLSSDKVHPTDVKRKDCLENLTEQQMNMNEHIDLRIAQIVNISDNGTYLVKYKNSDDLHEMYLDDIETIVESTKANIPNVSLNESLPTTESIEKLSKSSEVVDDKNDVMIQIEPNFVLQQISSDKSETGSKCFNKEELKFQEGDNVVVTYTDGDYCPAKIVEYCGNDSCKAIYTDYDETLYEVEIGKIKITDKQSNTLIIDIEKVNSSEYDNDSNILINDIEKVSSSESTIAVSSESTETQQEKQTSDVSSDYINIKYSVGDNILALYKGEKYSAEVISISVEEKTCIIKYDDTNYDELYEISLNDIEPSPVRNIKNDEKEGLLPEFLESTEVLVKNEEDEYYEAKKVSISSNNTSHIVKYIDYDECGEVNLNDVKTVDDQFDDNYENTPTNLGKEQEILTNHLTKIDDISDIKFKPGQRVLALYEDGVYYPAIIIKCSVGSNNCSIVYDGFSDEVELNLNEIKPIEFKKFDYVPYNTDLTSIISDSVPYDTDMTSIISENVPYNNNLKSNAKSNLKCSVGDEVIAKYENGVDYEAIIYEFLNEKECIVQFINNEFAKAFTRDIKPIESIRSYKLEKKSDSNANEKACVLYKNDDKENLENNEDISSKSSNETYVFSKGFKSLYSENDIIKVIHCDGNQYIGKIMKLLNTNLYLVKFNDLNEIYEVELNKIIEKLDMDSSVKENSSVTLKVPKFLEHELVVAESKDGEQYDVEILKIVPANGTYIVKSIGTNKYFEIDFDALKSKTNITSSEPEYFVQSTTEISCRSESALTTNPIKVMQNKPEYAQPLVFVSYSDGMNYLAKVISFNSDVNTCIVKFWNVDVLQEVHIKNFKPYTFYETPELLRQQLTNPVGYSYTQSGPNSIALKPINQELTNSNISIEQVFSTLKPSDNTIKYYCYKQLYEVSLKDIEPNLVKNTDEKKFFISEFSEDNKIPEKYEDGEYCKAKLLSISSNNISNIVKYIDYDECDKVYMNDVKIVGEEQELLTNHFTKIDEEKSDIKFKPEQKMCALFNEFAKDIKPRELFRSQKLKVINEIEINNVLMENSSDSDTDNEACNLENNGYKENLEKYEDISKSFNETSVSNKSYPLEKNGDKDNLENNEDISIPSNETSVPNKAYLLERNGYKENLESNKDISKPSNETSVSNKRLKSSYSENDIIKVIHSDEKQYIGKIMKLLNTDLCLVKFNDLNKIYEVELNKIIEKLDMDFSVTDNSSITLKVPKFLEHELVVAESKDGEQYDVEIIKIVPANGTYIVKSIGTNKYFEIDFDAVKSKTNITSSEPECFVQSTSKISCKSESALTTNPMKVVQNNPEYTQPLAIANYVAKVINFNSDVNTCIVKFWNVGVFQEVHIANFKPFTFYETPGILRQLSNPVDYSYTQSGSNSIALKPINQELTNSNFSTEQVFGTQSPNDMHMTSLLNLQQGLAKMDEGEDIVKQVAQRANANFQDFTKSADDIQNREHYSGTNLKVGDFVRAFYFDGQIYDAQVISIFETNQTCQINYLALNMQQNIPWRYVLPMQRLNRDCKDILNVSSVLCNQNPALIYWFLRGYYFCFYQTLLSNK